jgi:predicted Zn-dependent peptidase
MINQYVHDRLPCGMEYGVLTLPQRRVVSFQLRVLAGLSAEPMDKLGLAGLVEDTIDKGTEKRTGPELSDAFDAIGAGVGSGTGRETMTFTCTVLPEHFERAVALHAEFLRAPTFPQDVFEVSLELTRQEQDALEDQPSGLVDKYISRKAYGPVLGRHALGEPETIAGITRNDLVSYWRENFVAGRMIASVAGPIDARQAADILQKHFEGFGSSEQRGREAFPVQFTPETTHYPKELEQEQIGICWPGVDATHEAFPTQQVTLGILSGGMSGRLFTEVREKRGLVYWVSAWQETPRGAGMIFLGASTTPQRCDETYETLLREVERLAEDIEQEELERAMIGIVAQQETRGDTTRSRCVELGNDLFFFGRPVPPEEKVARIKAVTISGIRDYLDAYPRDRLCVVTLGPRPLSMQASNRQNVEMSKR